MTSLYSNEVGTRNKKPRRFAIRFDAKKNNFSRSDWIDDIRVISFWWLRSLRNNKKKLNKREWDEKHKIVYLRSKEKWDKSGRLVTNHILGVASIIGMVPLKFAELYQNANACPGVKELVETKGLLPGQDAANQYLDALSCAL